jgi:ABC-type multidrug transport system fused ATPase/permease subunit
MQFTKKIIIKSLPASPLIVISIYFGIGAFLYIGFDLPFSILSSITVVGLMEYVSQVIVYLFKIKRIGLAIMLIFVWLIFFVISVATSCYSIWNMMDIAKNKRQNTAIENINDSKEIKLLDIQIELLIEKIKACQDDYKNPANNSWVKENYISPDLNQAQIDLDKRIAERKQMIESEKILIESREIGVNESGNINPILKIIIAILLAVIVDIGGCIIIMFSWVFGNKSIITNIEIKPIKNIIQSEIKHKPITIIEKAAAFYDTFFIPGNNKFIRGRSQKLLDIAQITPNDYSIIKEKAISKGYLYIEDKKTKIGAAFDFENNNIKDIFVKGVSENDSPS